MHRMKLISDCHNIIYAVDYYLSLMHCRMEISNPGTRFSYVSKLRNLHVYKTHPGRNLRSIHDIDLCFSFFFLFFFFFEGRNSHPPSITRVVQTRGRRQSIKRRARPDRQETADDGAFTRQRTSTKWALPTQYGPTTKSADRERSGARPRWKCVTFRHVNR